MAPERSRLEKLSPPKCAPVRDCGVSGAGLTIGCCSSSVSNFQLIQDGCRVSPNTCAAKLEAGQQYRSKRTVILHHRGGCRRPVRAAGRAYAICCFAASPQRTIRLGIQQDVVIAHRPPVRGWSKKAAEPNRDRPSPQLKVTEKKYLRLPIHGGLKAGPRSKSR